MILKIADNVKVIELADGSVEVTRPTMTGRVASHVIISEYDAAEIAYWLKARIVDRAARMVQDRFPNMSADDREFLMTGITPTEWNKMFPASKI